jgi:Flp pilus assembly secretin CpaC
MFSVSPSSRWAIVAGMSAFAITASVFRVEAADLLVRYDQSQLIRLPRPVSEIIIGNPSIADVNVQGGNLLVVTGKTFGVTNIIALDADKNVIQDQRVIVEQDDRRTVVVYRGSLRHSYTCAPTCSPATVVGDAQEYFDATIKAAQAKAGASVPDKSAAGQQSE